MQLSSRANLSSGHTCHPERNRGTLGLFFTRPSYREEILSLRSLRSPQRTLRFKILRCRLSKQEEASTLHCHRERSRGTLRLLPEPHNRTISHPEAANKNGEE